MTSAAAGAVLVGEHGAVGWDGAHGSAAGPELRARWDLVFGGDEPPLAHLPYPWMYSAPVPRTKATSPRPDMVLNGTVEINGETTGVDGWRGMLGHNWGTGHAHAWIWLRGAGFAGSPATWLDVVIGRIRIGPVLVPWVAHGVFCLSGVRHVLGGLARRPAVHTRSDGVDLTLRGPELGVTVTVDSPLRRSVGWQYADPTGKVHHVRNCSNAGMRVEIMGDRGDALTTTTGAIYELGTPEPEAGLVIQSFPDT